MGKWSTRQQAAIAAVASAILYVVGFTLPGSPPKFSADPATIVAFFYGHHKKVLVSLLLVEIGTAITVALIAQLAVILRDAGKRSHAAVVGIAGAASVGSLAVGYGLFGGLGQLAGFTPEQGAVPPLYRVIQFVQTGWFWMTFVLILTVALAAWEGAFPRWVAAVNGIVAVLMLLAGLSVKAHGAFSAGTGAFVVIGGIAYTVWVLHLAVLFWLKPSAASA